eukprot:COSAG06_NODE_5813_length_3260_cov_19.840240_1_plen_229_part_00
MCASLAATNRGHYLALSPCCMPTVDELRAELENRGLDTAGKKQDLQDRLLAAVVSPGSTQSGSSDNTGAATRQQKKRSRDDQDGAAAAAASAAGEGGVSQEALLKQLECPVCLETIPPPINQCEQGHALCTECKEKLPQPRKCPECRAKLSTVRNLMLEQLVAKISLPCSYASGGCDKTVKYGDLQAHRETCDFRPFSCPATTWRPTTTTTMEVVATFVARSSKSWNI